MLLAARTSFKDGNTTSSRIAAGIYILSAQRSCSTRRRDVDFGVGLCH